MVIVDTAPRIDADAPALAALADLIVIPVRPTMPDLVASQSAFRMAQSSNRPFSIVISQANTRSIEAADARAGLSEHYDVAPMMLSSQGTDEIQKKLDTTVSDIEALCRPIIKATAIAS
jgi:chromosome partitioning protein